MSDNKPVDFEFSFAPYKGFQPYTGDGGSDMFPFDGLIEVKVGTITPYRTKGKDGVEGKPAVKVHGTAQDSDAGGLRVIDDVLCGGQDRNGEDLGRQFIEFMLSTGTTLESIHKNAESGAKGSIQAIAKGLVGRTAYAEIEADVYDGKQTTKVRNWVTKERYEQAKTIGAHRRPRRTVAAGAAAGGAGTAVGGGAANGVAPAAVPAAGGSALPML